MPKPSSKKKSSPRRGRSRHKSTPAKLQQSVVSDIEEEDTSSEMSNMEGDQAEKKDSQKEILESLKQLHVKFDKIDREIHGADVGIKDRVDTAIPKLERLEGKLAYLSKENKLLRAELNIIKGLVQKQHQQMESMSTKMTESVARGMENNLIFSGLKEKASEDIIKEILEFLSDKLNVQIDRNQIVSANRMGQARPDVYRSIFVQVKPEIKEVIMSSANKLRDKKNEKGMPYYINVQQPEAMVEARKNARAIFNKKIHDPNRRLTVEMRKNRVYVNKVLERPLISAPTPNELFPDADEQKEMNKLKFVYTALQEERGSNFWVVMLKISGVAELRRAYRKIRQEHPSVNHVMVGYSVQHDGKIKYGHVDDNKHGAGFKIQGVIRKLKKTGVAIFVIRKFGGEHLGPRRFEIIKGLAEKALVQIAD